MCETKSGLDSYRLGGEIQAQWGQETNLNKPDNVFILRLAGCSSKYWWWECQAQLHVDALPGVPLLLKLKGAPYFLIPRRMEVRCSIYS